ncbi:MAG: MerR family transcriptional regulator [Magnetococcus sp. DMHC-1]|nr:MerR family transcriptional regulator [Magnetococcales bacterium]
MWTIGKLARHFGLSRSTLLYYDRIGLLSPSLRSTVNYRLYSEVDFKRMERIATLREAGIPLDKIRDLCDRPTNSMEEALEYQLFQTNQEIAKLRTQQHAIIKLLKHNNIMRQSRIMDKAGWINLLEGAGMDDTAKNLWHVLFEKNAPLAHQDFLESLGIEQEEINQIRAYAQAAIHDLPKNA